MKTVLLTINNNRLSGIERFTVLLAKYLDKEKFRVTVGVPTYGTLCKILESNQIDYFIFNNKGNEKYSLSGIVFLFKHILKNRYDTIHAQAGIAPCLIGKLLGINLIIEHRHGLDFTSEQIRTMNFMRVTYEKMKKYFVDLTVTVCAKDKDILINKFKYNTNKINVIYNGIEDSSNNFPVSKNSKFTIGTIGRLTFQKGHEYLIQAAKKLSDEGFDFEFLIYGEGEKFSELKFLIESQKLSEKVYLKGYTEDIKSTLKSFDIFVLPSRYEGIPYVLLEAMRECIPVIATDVGGISEVINNMVNGILVEKGNPEIISEKIKLLYKSENLRKTIIENAKKDFEERYTINKTVAAIQEIYEY